MIPRSFRLPGAAVMLVLAVPAAAQSSPHAMPQIEPAVRSANAAVSKDATATADGVGAPEQRAPAVSAEVLAACLAAEREDRDPPEGVDCMAAMQQSAEAQPARSAEGSLLEMIYGQRANVASSSASLEGNSLNADTVARQLSSGDIQTISNSDAAAAAATRQRSTPPPPPSGGPR